MRKKPMRKNRHKVKYYEGKRSSRTALFLTAFFVTLALEGFMAGFAVVDANTRKVGWNEASQVFDVINAGSGVNVTLMGNNFSVEPVDFTFLNGVKRAAISFEPDPVQFAQIACARVSPYINYFFKFCENLLPENLRTNN